MSETLTLSLAKSILDAIKTYLSSKRPKETKILKDNLVKLVKLSSNSSLELRNYVTFMKLSIKAGAKCTDLTMVLKTLSEEEGKKRFESLIEVLSHLRKDGVEAIRDYREDYEKATKHCQNAEKFAKDAESDFLVNKKVSCNEKTQYASNELDDLDILGNRRINKLVDGLLDAYKILEQVGG